MQTKAIVAKSASIKSNKTKKSVGTFYKVAAIFTVLIIGIWIYVILTQWPIEEEERVEEAVGFTTEYIDDNAMELGTDRVEQEGQLGKRAKIWKIKKKGLLTKTEVDRTFDSSEELQSPTNKIIRRGTRKWQYMICSDGNYRYYDDETFANGAGFTHSSEDYCAKNGQGTMVELADTPPQHNTSSNYSTYIPYHSYTPSYVPSNSTPLPDSTAHYESSDWNQWSPSGSTSTQVTPGGCGFSGNTYICY